MKKQILYCSFVISILLCLTACTGPYASLTTQSASTDSAVATGQAATSLSGQETEIHMTVDGKCRTHIPDPATAGQNVTISLRDPEKDPAFDSEHCKKCMERYYDGEYCKKHTAYCWQNYFTDLSFAGFPDPVLIFAFSTGSLLQKDAKKKDCLALLVNEPADQNTDDLSSAIQEGRNYLVILDYAGGRCSKTSTDFFSHHSPYFIDDMVAFTDLTGDGTNELVIQHNYNKSISLEVHRYEEKTHTTRMIFSNPDGTSEEEACFSGHLTDDYRAVIAYKKIGFQKTVSLLDAGYKKSQLEATSNYPDPVEDDYQFVRLWKNGRLQKEGKDPETVFLYTLDDVSFDKNKKKQPQLRLMHGVFVGHRAECIGDLYAYFQYNPKKDLLELSGAKFMIEQENK